LILLGKNLPKSDQHQKNMLQCVNFDKIILVGGLPEDGEKKDQRSLLGGKGGGDSQSLKSCDMESFENSG